jgi:ATP-binding cassette subfamily B protein
MRFYELDDGEIAIDGHQYTSALGGTICAVFFGMVLQDTWPSMARSSINIRYGREDATYEEVVRAADIGLC